MFLLHFHFSIFFCNFFFIFIFYSKNYKQKLLSSIILLLSLPLFFTYFCFCFCYTQRLGVSSTRMQILLPPSYLSTPVIFFCFFPSHFGHESARKTSQNRFKNHHNLFSRFFGSIFCPSQFPISALGILFPNFSFSCRRPSGM